MSLEMFRDVALIFGTLGTLIAIGKGVVEYSKNNRIKRAEYFSSMQSEMHKLLVDTQIVKLLDSNISEINNLSDQDILIFLDFYEKVALMLNSDLLNEDVAYYMFGYYAIQCYDNQYFRQLANMDEAYWSLFVKFIERMKTIKSKNKIPKLIENNKLKF